MSTASQASWTGISAARKRLALLAHGLRSTPQIVAEAAAEVAERVRHVAAEQLVKHQQSGAAAGSLTVTTSGGLVTATTLRYPGYHKWWSFRRGMPPFMIKQASVILARRLLLAIGANPARSPAVLAAEEVVEGERARAAKKATKDRVKALNRDIKRQARKAKR